MCAARQTTRPNNHRKHVCSIQSTTDANFQRTCSFRHFPFSRRNMFVCRSLGRYLFFCPSVCLRRYSMNSFLSCFSTQFLCSKLCLKTAISRICKERMRRRKGTKTAASSSLSPHSAVRSLSLSLSHDQRGKRKAAAAAERRGEERKDERGHWKEGRSEGGRQRREEGALSHTREMACRCYCRRRRL